MFDITHLKNIFPTSLLIKNANIQKYKIITIQLLSTGVMVPIPKQISWSYGTQTIRNVLQLPNTEQKSQNGERTLKKKKYIYIYIYIYLEQWTRTKHFEELRLTVRWDVETSDVGRRTSSRRWKAELLC